MKSIAINWKTSATGIAAVLGAIAHMLTTRTIGAEDITAIFTGVGLIFAKDGNVTGGTVSQPSN